MRTKGTAGLRRAWAEKWARNRVLYLCLLWSAIAHFLVLVSVGPPWMRRPLRLKPRAVKAVSLRIMPRAIAPARPERRPDAVKPPPPRRPPERIYPREREIERARPEDVTSKFGRAPRVRAKDVISGKSREAMAWVAREYAAFEETLTREEAGDVGYRRIIDLKANSASQISRLMEHYKMDIGYGSRVIIDMNLQFTSVWLLTRDQVTNYLVKSRAMESRKILASFPAEASDVELKESGEGEARPYVKPSIAAVAALLKAEEEYFSSTGINPEELDSLVFTPVWGYFEPSFTVARAEKKSAPQGEGQDGGAAAQGRAVKQR